MRADGVLKKEIDPSRTCWISFIKFASFHTSSRAFPRMRLPHFPKNGLCPEAGPWPLAGFRSFRLGRASGVVRETGEPLARDAFSTPTPSGGCAGGGAYNVLQHALQCLPPSLAHQ